MTIISFLSVWWVFSFCACANASNEPSISSPVANEQNTETFWHTLAIIFIVLFILQCIFVCLIFKSKAEDETQASLGNIKYEELSFGKVLGKGAYGVVYQGKWCGKDVAIKKFNQEETEDVHLNTFMLEVGILHDLRHPNCVLFMGACVIKPNLCIVTELLKISMYDWINSKPKPNIPYIERARIILDAALGMLYLHQMGIFHHDLKSPNLLLGEHFNCKVSDFGMISFKPGYRDKLLGGSGSFNIASRVSSALNIHKTLTGTDSPLPSPGANQVAGSAFWAAPELIKGEPFTEKADVYSLGIIMAEIANMDTPYPKRNSFAVTIEVATSGLRPEIDSSCPTEFSTLAIKCWNSNPSFRPAFDEIAASLDDMVTNWKDNISKTAGSTRFSGNLRGIHSNINAVTKETGKDSKWWLRDTGILSKTKLAKVPGNLGCGELFIAKVNPSKLKSNAIGTKKKKKNNIVDSVIYTRSVIFSSLPKTTTTVTPDDHDIVPIESEVVLRKVKISRLGDHIITLFGQTMEKRYSLVHPCLEIVHGGYWSLENSLTLYIFSKRYPLGSLKNLLDKKKIRTWKLRLGILEDVAHGLQFLHSRKIIHKNIKSSNILCKEPEDVSNTTTNGYSAVLADFGFDKIWKTENRWRTRAIGTSAWCPPEVLVLDDWGFEADIYAFGIVMWELLSEQLPFEGMNDEQILRAVTVEKERPKIPEFDSLCVYNESARSLYDNYVNTMESCWAADKNQRPNAEELFQGISNLISMELLVRYQS